MKHRTFILLLIAILSLGLIGCDDDEVITKDPELYVMADKYILNIGDEKEIDYFVDHLGDHLVVIESSDENVFTVDGDKIKAVAPGDAVLIIRIEGFDLEESIDIQVLSPKGSEELQILEWAKTQIGYNLIDFKPFPTKHPTYPQAVITYESLNPELVSDMGILYEEDYDTEAEVKITVTFDGRSASSVHTVNVVGLVPKNISKDFFNQFPYYIISDITINYFKDKYPQATITLSSSNTQLFSNTGKVTRPENDATVMLTALIVIPSKGYSQEFTKNIVLKGITTGEKANIVRENLISLLKLDKPVATALELPDVDELYGGTLTWSSSVPEVISNNGQFVMPLLNLIIELRAVYTLAGESTTIRIPVEVTGSDSLDKWDNIEEFLNTYIFLDEIKTMGYDVMGVGPTYRAYNEGYVNFYTNDSLSITQDLLSTSHPMRPKTYLNVQYITVHDTANNKLGADVIMHSKYIHQEDRTVSSWHYTVDDINLYQHIPDNEVAWHAGTAAGNSSAIGIETCTHIGVDYDLVIRRLAKLVAGLLDKHNLTIGKVVQHNYWSGKDCPQVIRHSNRWQEVLDLVSLELYGQQKLKDVNFVWESLSPTILDNTGKVFNHPGAQTDVSYKVTVTYAGVTKVYTHTATLQASKAK